jgi:hypothetical protein
MMRPSPYRHAASTAARPGERPAPPTTCPACRSRAIASVVINPDENAYWHCDSCGEVWNAARRSTAIDSCIRDDTALLGTHGTTGAPRRLLDSERQHDLTFDVGGVPEPP